MPSSEEERAERLFRQKQDAPKALAGLSRKARGHSQVDGEAARRTFGTRSATGEDGSVKKVTKKSNGKRLFRVRSAVTSRSRRPQHARRH
jgi:hypothetical protein